MGPGQTRNYGEAERARSEGEYLIILLDSDGDSERIFRCHQAELLTSPTADAFDCNLLLFLLQLSKESDYYSMTSFSHLAGRYSLWKKKMDKFYPRSFNMEVRQTG